jgi:hypothetical protein
MPRKEPRDYKEEYREYHGKDEQVKNRSSRNKAVRKKGRAGAGDGMEVDHIDGNPRNNSAKNLRVVKRTTNRRKG